MEIVELLKKRCCWCWRSRFSNPRFVRKGLEIVIANGAECEPLLFNDKYILAEHGED